MIESQQARSLPGEYLVLPGQKEVPTSSLEPAEPVLPDPAIYALAQPYPASPVEIGSIGTMAGRRIVSPKVFPLQYVPAERKLVFNDDLSFRVEMVDDGASDLVAPRETRKVAGLRNDIVGRMVENAEAVTAGGYYDDEFIREDGAWKFAHRKLVFYHRVPLSKGWPSTTSRVSSCGR